MTEKLIKLHAYSVSELAVIYGIHRDTMRKWLKPFAGEIGERNGRFYSINQVKIIFECLGWPERDEDD